MTAARRNEWARAARAPRGGCVGVAPGRAGARLGPGRRVGRGGGLPASVCPKQGRAARNRRATSRGRREFADWGGSSEEPGPPGKWPEERSYSLLGHTV